MLCNDNGQEPITVQVTSKQPYMNKRLPPAPSTSYRTYDTQEQESIQIPQIPQIPQRHSQMVSFDSLRERNNSSSVPPSMLPNYHQSHQSYQSHQSHPPHPSQQRQTHDPYYGIPRQDPYYDRPDPRNIQYEDDEATAFQERLYNITRYDSECGDVIEEMKKMKDSRVEKMSEVLNEMTNQASHSENLLRLNHICYFPGDIYQPRRNTMGGRVNLKSLTPGEHNKTTFKLISGDSITKGAMAFNLKDAHIKLKNAVLAEVNLKFFRNHTPVSMTMTILRKYGDDKSKPLETTGSYCFNNNERCHYLSHADTTHYGPTTIFRNEPSANHPYATDFPDLNSDMSSIDKGVVFAGNERRVPKNHIAMRFLSDNLHLRKYKDKGWMWPTESNDYKGYYLFDRVYYEDVAKEISTFVEEHFPVTNLTTLSLDFTPTTEIIDNMRDDTLEKNYIDFSIELVYGLRGMHDA